VYIALSQLISSCEEVSLGMSPCFFIQKIDAKELEKKMHSIHECHQMLSEC
jgi:hypothetical protein